MKDISKKELLEINGGRTFGFRVGQAIALACDLYDGNLSTKGGIRAAIDWFS